MLTNNIVAIIPARGGSKGILNKNIIDFCGKPLIAWTIEQCLYSKYISDVWVSSDSQEILNVAEKYGAKIISRPNGISGDLASSESAWKHAIETIQEYNNIQYKTTVGNNVIMWAGNHIGHHSIIEDHCFFTSHVCMSGHCHIGSHSYLGVNASIRDFGEIAEGTFVSMDTSITKNITEPWGMYRGSPARRLKNVE